MSGRISPDHSPTAPCVDLDTPPTRLNRELRTKFSSLTPKQPYPRESHTDLILALFKRAREESWAPTRLNFELKETNKVLKSKFSSLAPKLNRSELDFRLEVLVKAKIQLRNRLISSIDCFVALQRVNHPQAISAHRKLLNLNRGLRYIETIITGLRS
jgi:hypothetical protein